uniref:TFIIS-type domain-containing protein n=1 Tax=viral metagenome TaxID=1070528 RepID=A0A6C0BLA6_9ZZZZ
MIRLKIKTQPTPTTVSSVAPAPAPAPAGISTPRIFEKEIEPYASKVRSMLSQTAVNPQLIILLEMAIRSNAIKNTQKLDRITQFDTFKTIYLTIARHIIENLKTNNEINNVELIEKVNQGQITADQVVNMKPEDMHSERWRSLIEQKQADINKLTNDPEETSNIFWCTRCHRNKTTYFLRQDRSADEPMTVHITCCFCGRKWRQ